MEIIDVFVSVIFGSIFHLSEICRNLGNTGLVPRITDRGIWAVPDLVIPGYRLPWIMQPIPDDHEVRRDVDVPDRWIGENLRSGKDIEIKDPDILEVKFIPDHRALPAEVTVLMPSDLDPGSAIGIYGRLVEAAKIAEGALPGIKIHKESSPIIRNNWFRAEITDLDSLIEFLELLFAVKNRSGVPWSPVGEDFGILFQGSITPDMVMETRIPAPGMPHNAGWEAVDP